MRTRSLAVLAALAACGKTPPSPDPNPPPSASLAAIASASPSASEAPSAQSDAVSHASQVRVDDGPSVLASGKVDGAALRKKHVERLKTDLSPVTMLQGDTAKDLGKRICEAVVPKKPKDTPILLKPNLCGYDSVKDPEKTGGDNGVTGRTTDPEFVRGVVQCLKARGHDKITIADGCGHAHKYFEELIKLDGYEAMAKEENVPLVAMDDDGVFDVQGDQPGKPMAVSGIGDTHVPTLMMPKILAEALDHGLFISIPKVKAHRYAVVSLAIKGMQGTIMYSDRSPAYQQKWRSHKELKDYLEKKKDGEEDRKLYVATLQIFAERMVDALEISTPDVVLLEGAPGEGGDGFQVLKPTAEKVAIGGTNPILVDRIGAEFLGLWNNAQLANQLGGHRTSPLIEVAAKRYKVDIASPALTGDGAALLSVARPTHFKAMAPFSIDFEPKPGDKPPPATPLPNFAPIPVTPGSTATPAASGGKPEAHAVSLGEGAIKIDGSSDDDAWSRAKAVSFDTDYAGNKAGIGTKVRFAWSKKALYAFFDVSNTGLNTDHDKPITEERKGLYNEDCVELFIAPDKDHIKHYYELELGPFGHFFDIDVNKETGKTNTSWSGALKLGTKQDKGARTAAIEVEVGASEIAGALTAGARLPLGIYRMEGTGDRKYLAWSPPKTEKPNFHVPEAFGVLVLDP